MELKSEYDKIGTIKMILDYVSPLHNMTLSFSRDFCIPFLDTFLRTSIAYLRTWNCTLVRGNLVFCEHHTDYNKLSYLPRRLCL